MTAKDRTEAEVSALAERLVAADFGKGPLHSRELLANHAASSPERTELHASMMRLWEDLEQVDPPPLFAERATPAPTRLWSIPRGGWAVAASILPVLVAIGLVLGMLGMFGTSRSAATELRTAANERRIVGLADGSIVTLGADTVLAVDLRGDRRALTLKQGEALFDVSHDPARPFVVDAGPGSVQALGTRFNIRLDDEVVVTVTEGKVAVTSGTRSRSADVQRLSQVAVAGQQVRFGEGSEEGNRPSVPGKGVGNYISTARSVDAERFTSWTQGVLRFDGEPLGVVIDEVNRYSASKVLPVDPAIADTPIYGVFHIGDVDGLRQVVRDIHGIERRASESRTPVPTAD